MNKKFLSAILFGALMVTSTGTFVSCKDYDGDIEELWDAVGGKASAEDLKTQISSMTSLLNGAQSAADAAAAAAAQAKQAADAALAKAQSAEAKAAAEAARVEAAAKAEAAAAQAAAIAAAKADVAALEAKLTAAMNTKVDQSAFNALAAEVANLKAQVEYLAGAQLKSLVFAPEMYMDGVEAFEAKYMPYKALSVPNTARKTTYKSIEYTTNEGAIAFAKTVTVNNPTMYVNYHMNPTTVKVDQFKDNLSFLSGDYDFVNTGRAAAAAPKATYKSHKDGVLTVAVDLKAQSVMNQETGNQFVTEFKDNNNKITTLALQALVEGDKADTTVVSDYAAVYASQIQVEAIAYPKTAKIAYQGTGCAEPETGLHLFDDAIEAIAAKPTVHVAWNSSVNLATLVETHYKSNSATTFGNDFKVKTWAYGEEAAYNLAYEFALVEYKGGKNATSESENAQLNGSVLRPCGVVASTGKASGVQGIETVGRMPLVRVTLKDTQNNKVVSIGYIKFLIVESETPKETKPFSLGNVYYSCNGQFGKLTWAETQTELLGATAATSKDTFDKLYELEMTGKQAAQYKKVGTEYVALKENEFIGNVVENVDETAPTTTCLKWTVYQTDFAALRNKATVNDAAKTITYTHRVYVKYVGEEGKDGNVGVAKTPIYVPIDLTFNYPYGTLNNKLANKWYAANSTTQGNAEIHVNVEVPSTTVKFEDEGLAPRDAKIEFFKSDLDNYFMINKTQGHKVASVTANAADATEADAPTFGVAKEFKEWQDALLAYVYYFTPANDYRVSKTEVKGISGKSYKLSVGTASGAWTDTEFASVIVDKYDEAYSSTAARSYNSVAIYVGKDMVLEINPSTGIVELQDNDTAKDLLNLVSHKDLAKTFTANIGVAAFNDCANLLPMADKTYNAKFLRPVDVEQGAVKNFTDAVDGDTESTEKVNGAWAYVLNMVKLNDWRDQFFVDKNLDYFNYYGVEAITIKTDDIRTDMKKDAAGKWELLSKTNTAIYFKQVDANGNAPVAANVPAENATMADLLKNYGKLLYFNNTGNTVEFNAEIPVKVTYKWGEITILVTCHIGGTLNN